MEGETTIEVAPISAAKVPKSHPAAIEAGDAPKKNRVKGALEDVAKTTDSHPRYTDMITKSLENLAASSTRRGFGASFVSIKNEMKSSFGLDDLKQTACKKALAKLIEDNVIVLTNGSGLNGHYRLVPKKKTAPKRAKKAVEGSTKSSGAPKKRSSVGKAKKDVVSANHGAKVVKKKKVSSDAKATASKNTKAAAKTTKKNSIGSASAKGNKKTSAKEPPKKVVTPKKAATKGSPAKAPTSKKATGVKTAKKASAK